MSTRGMFTFKGVEEYEGDWNVYKHSDMYPTGAADTLEVAQAWFAWKAPRYESDEFAAAVIAAGKAWALIDKDGLQPADRRKRYMPGGEYNHYTGGGMRLMPQGDPTQVAVKNCGDIAYRYEIYEKTTRGKKELWVKAISGDWWIDRGGRVGNNDPTEEVIIECRLVDFPKKAKAYEAKAKAA